MRRVRMGLASLALLAFAGSSEATTGTLKIGWGGCNDSPITDLAITPQQATTANLVAFVTGQDDPTLSYQVWILYGNAATRTVPDAWRFDGGGCEGSLAVTLNHLAPATLSATCPSFQDAGTAHPASIQIKDLGLSPPNQPFATTLERIVVANAYWDKVGGMYVGNTPVAGRKYFLMDAEFNFASATEGPTDGAAGTCGGLETPVCFNVVTASYLINDGSGNELPFRVYGDATGDWATAHSASQGSAPFCQATPAQPRTWGSIKSQYRD